MRIAARAMLQYHAPSSAFLRDISSILRVIVAHRIAHDIV